MKTQSKTQKTRKTRKYEYRGVRIMLIQRTETTWTGQTDLGFVVHGSLKHVCREITADIDYYKEGESK